MARGLHGTTSPSRFHHATREAEPKRSGVRGRACRCDRAHSASPSNTSLSAAAFLLRGRVFTATS
ncbi:hypothetical protein ABZP36_025296 [Zizania latifolia]